jgi:transcriptional regulator with XRE-family HTH domain
MHNAQQLHITRITAKISGDVLCSRARIRRARLSQIERGYLTPSADELARIQKALDELINARKEVQAVAERVGWPMESL